MSAPASPESARREWHRPALDVLARDVRTVREELLVGLASRQALIWWEHDLVVATLGQVNLDLLVKLGQELSTTTETGEAGAIAALLASAAREREINETSARRMRRALASRMIEPAHHRATRVLQVSAQEYVDDDGDTETSDHDPDRQRATAMRPSVDEAAARQRAVLDDLLDGRLADDRSAVEPDVDVYVLDWIDRLDVATDGLMAILDRMAVETSFRSILTGSEPRHARAREVLAARWIIPTCSLSIRRLAVGASEVPDAAPLDREVPMA
jgi:hypothetical protein